VLRIEHLLDAASLKMRMLLNFVHKEPPGHTEQYCCAVHVDWDHTIGPRRQRSRHDPSPSAREAMGVR
jgi:hypothetical protein